MASIEEQEERLNQEHAGKVGELTYYVHEKGFQTKVAIVDRLAIDSSTKNIPQVIIFFNDGKKFEVDQDDFLTDFRTLTHGNT
jgi:hypothetical protein